MGKAKPAKELGEYWIKNYTLLQREYMWPLRFNVIVREFCLRFIQIENDLISDNRKRSIYDSFINMGRCIDTSTRLNGGIILECFTFNNKHIIAEIVDEFYPEGSDFFASGVLARYWLPSYPSYVPCAQSRRQVAAQNVTKVSVYICEDESVIADTLVCNGIEDCSNAEDEQQCSSCSLTDPLLPACKCDTKFYYQCESSGCIYYDQLCDSVVDCPDGDDEMLCYSKKQVSAF